MNRCADCAHGQPATRYPPEYRHCHVAAKHYRLPLPAWAGTTCPPEVAKWEPIDIDITKA